MSERTVNCVRCGRVYYVDGDSAACPHACSHKSCIADLERQLAEAQGKLDTLAEALRPYKCQCCEEQGAPDTTLDGQPAHYIAGGMAKVVCRFNLDRILGKEEE